MKLTRRKGFNFFRSYFDVYNELNDKDKLAFIEALLNRQFLGVKPRNLKGMAKFAYISQTNSIDQQVKGYEHKTGDIITPPEGVLLPPTEGGRQGGSIGGQQPPSRQVQVEVQVEDNINNPFPEKSEKVDWDKLKEAFIQLTGKKIRVVNQKTKNQINARLKEGYTKDDLWRALVNCSRDKYHLENPKFLTLEFISRSDKLEKYMNV